MTMYCALNLPSGSHPHPRNLSDLFVPDGSDASALVVCLHGGWWSQGRHEELRAFCLALAEQGIPSASVGFRPLEPPRHGEELLGELTVAITRILEEAALCGLDGRSLILLGSGSGSLLALVLASQLSQDPKLRVRAVVACGVTPSLDHADGIAPSLVKHIDQFAGASRHALSPLHLRPETFPPVLLVHGDSDTEVPAKTVQRLHQRLIDAGESSTLAVLSQVGHQFLEAPYEREGRAALERILPFLRDHLLGPVADETPQALDASQPSVL
jgi:acetyl esterase/lipase